MASERLIPEETVCETLGVAADELREWVRLGLIAPSERDGAAYSPEQVRRAWSIISLHHDLDVNLEGVRIILEMSDEIRSLQWTLREVIRRSGAARRREAFPLKIVEEIIGVTEWEIEL